MSGFLPVLLWPSAQVEMVSLRAMASSMSRTIFSCCFSSCPSLTWGHGAEGPVGGPPAPTTPGGTGGGGEGDTTTGQPPKAAAFLYTNNERLEIEIF